MKTIGLSSPDILRERLEALAEPAFRQFSLSLLPTLPPERLLGVRLPALRRLAHEIVRGNWRDYLQNASDQSFEEILLQGMVIGLIPEGPQTMFPLVEAFLPKIDNWSVCDSFCSGLKLARRFPNETLAFLLPHLQDEREYTVRFTVVMLLLYFSAPEYTASTLALLDKVRHEGYYVRMAVAWAVSVCFAKSPTVTAGYLSRCRLDDFTHHKAIQKITESKRISAEEKALARSLDRGLRQIQRPAVPGRATACKP